MKASEYRCDNKECAKYAVVSKVEPHEPATCTACGQPMAPIYADVKKDPE